jgi:hypothetical protein
MAALWQAGGNGGSISGGAGDDAISGTGTGDSFGYGISNTEAFRLFQAHY